MTRTKHKRTTRVSHAAQELRRRAFAAPIGALLGSEDDLIMELEVSRPTLRQAAASVAQDQLIKIRRGVNGGYFAATPDSYTVSRMAALYLLRRKADFTSLMQAVGPIRSGLARLAARSQNEVTRDHLREFFEREIALEKGGEADYPEFLKAERTFGKLLGELSGNDTLHLFLNIIFDLVAIVGRETDVYHHHPERIAQYRTRRIKLIEAILDHDEEMVSIEAARSSKLVARWFDEDFSRVDDHEEFAEKLLGTRFN